MSESLLCWRDFSLAFRVDGGLVPAVKGVDLDVVAGETVAVVGESGSGKTVTALAALRLLPDSAQCAGSIRFENEEVLDASAERLAKTRGAGMGVIFQEPMTSLNPLHTVGRQVMENLVAHGGGNRETLRKRVLDLFAQVQLPDPERLYDAWPHQLSGGQRQRAMIAMALANAPRLLIADEPTTALDVTVEAGILRLLKKLQRESGMAMLFITHDLEIVRRFADRVAVMHQGLIVERGGTEEIFNTPKHGYTQKLLGASPQGLPEPPPNDGHKVLDGEDLRVWFPIRRGLLRRTVGHVKAVDGVSLSVSEGETVGVVGESGSGKTTLALALLRLVGSKGRIVFLGKGVDGLRGRALRPLRRAMQVVFQDPYGSLSPRMTAAQVVGEGLAVHDPSCGRLERREKAAGIMGEVGLDPEMMDRYPHEFSGGQRQRLAIARAMILRPDLVVLDEPTSALDRTVQGQVVDLLREMQRRHRLAFVFISHDLRVVRALAHKVIVMREGRVVEAADAAVFFESPKTEYSRELIDAAWGISRIAA